MDANNRQNRTAGLALVCGIISNLGNYEPIQRGEYKELNAGMFCAETPYQRTTLPFAGLGALLLTNYIITRVKEK